MNSSQSLRNPPAPASRARAGRAWLGPLLAAGGFVAALAGFGAEAPPAWETTLTTAWSGRSRIDGTAAPAAEVSAGEYSLSVLARQPLPWTGWYFTPGLLAENFTFSRSPVWPQRLQAYAVPLRLEYFQGDQPAAQLSLQPGYYFEKQFTGRAWDVPVQVVSGIPLTDRLHGVLGGVNGRFYHHPLPIFGLIWEQDKAWRAELVYPEPALVYAPRPDLEWRLGGELTGDGFLGDPRPQRTVVEYSCYRIGLECTRSWIPGQKWTFGAGLELLNSFDYFRRGEKTRGSTTSYLKVSLALSP